MTQLRSRQAAGFTLIELVVAITIVAILLAVAIPSYEEQMRRTRRGEGRRALLEMVMAQERYFTSCNRYAASFDGARGTCSGLGMPDAAPTTDNGYYALTLDGSDPQRFALTATTAGAQAGDLDCASLSIDSDGVRSHTGTGTLAQCWDGTSR